MIDDELVDAAVVAVAFGWSTGRLRVWRHRHPEVLRVYGHGKRGMALFRWGDVRHAHATVFEQEDHIA